MWLQSKVADGNCLVHSGHRWLSAEVAELGAMLESGIKTKVAGDFSSCCPLAEGGKSAGPAGCKGLVELSEGCRDGNEALAVSGCCPLSVLEMDTEWKVAHSIEVITGEKERCISGVDDPQIKLTGELGLTRWTGPLDVDYKLGAE